MYYWPKAPPCVYSERNGRGVLPNATCPGGVGTLGVLEVQRAGSSPAVLGMSLGLLAFWLAVWRWRLQPHYPSSYWSLLEKEREAVESQNTPRERGFSTLDNEPPPSMGAGGGDPSMGGEGTPLEPIPDLFMPCSVQLDYPSQVVAILAPF